MALVPSAVSAGGHFRHLLGISQICKPPMFLRKPRPAASLPLLTLDRGCLAFEEIRSWLGCGLSLTVPVDSSSKARLTGNRRGDKVRDRFMSPCGSSHKEREGKVLRKGREMQVKEAKE